MSKVMNRRIFVFVAMAVFAVAAWSQLLWKVEGNGLSKPSYLMGTHHFAPAAFIDSVKGLNDAIASCDAVYGELHKDSLMSEAAQQKMMHAMVAPADSTLDRVLTPEQYAVVKKVVDKYLGAYGVQIEYLNMLKPVGLSSQLEAMQAQVCFPDFDHDAQIDVMVQKKGVSLGKLLGGLETLDDQIQALFMSPIRVQAEALYEMCASDDEFQEAVNELSAAYINEDLDGMYRLIVEPDKGSVPTEEELEALIWGRNRKWVEKLKVLMPQMSVMTCVGSGHLPGEQGLINLLRKAGYTVTAVSK